MISLKQFKQENQLAKTKISNDEKIYVKEIFGVQYFWLFTLFKCLKFTTLFLLNREGINRLILVIENFIIFQIQQIQQ